MAKTQFPKRKIGTFFIWAILILPLFTIGGTLSTLSARNNPSLRPEADPNLVGPESLCLVFGNVLGTYSAGGDPGDVFDWEVTSSAGEVIFSRSGGIQLETIQVIFPQIGSYTVRLSVRRGTNSNFYEDQLTVVVQTGPEIALRSDYLLCSGAPSVLTALNPNTSNLSEFTIEWKDIEGNVIGTGNEFLAYSPGFYLIELFQTDASGNRSCVINGSTFVGPPVDFQIIPSSTSICEGASINFELDTPLSGDWFIQKDFTGTRTQIATGFDFSINSDNLSGPGLYLVTFQTTTTDFPDCISEKVIGFEVLEAPELTWTILNQPDDCFSSNGSISVRVDSDIDALNIPEINVIEGPITAGEKRTFSNLKPQVYSVVVEKNGCQVTQLVVLDALLQPTILDPTVVLQNESCNPEGISQGIATINFGSDISNGEYRVLEIGMGEIARGEIPTSGQADINLSAGSYLLEMKVDGCTYPIQSLLIESVAQVEFTVPSELNICESFVLTPDTNQNLVFTLTYPNGSTENINSGEGFTLTEAGPYAILGVSQDVNSSICPKKIEFNTTLSSTISFAPILAVEKCFDPIKYEIELQGISVEDASIRWLNDLGEIVGRGQTFYPPGLGDFSLLVQPLKSGFCPVLPVEFEVVAPIISVPMDLEANKICPSPSITIVSLQTNEQEVTQTEWIFFNESDQRQELQQFDNLFEIEVNRPGTYEAVAYNRLGCEIGRSFILVEVSELLDSPVLEEEYGVCTKGKKGPMLNPGAFEEYFWYLEEQLVSTSPQFSPTKVGRYSLKVLTLDGCAYFTTFTTFDACSFEYVFPNAMILDDPQRNFEVRVSEGITSVELFIINRQGSLIHYDQSLEIPFGEPILQWDGKISGANIPSGSYVVVLIGKNPLYQFEEKIIGSLLVLD